MFIYARKDYPSHEDESSTAHRDIDDVGDEE